MTPHSLFVLGGARSGKSRYAQQRAEALSGRHVFIATAEAFDDEMRDRIARHRADRDLRWETVDAPRELVAAIDAQSGQGAVVLVDCLTLWASNLLLAEADLDLAAIELCASIQRFEGALVLVSNEVGFSIVPENPLARRFRDVAGRLNQHVASSVAEAQMVVAGIPLLLKGQSGVRP
ncbi:bifunctional adenosylcobinamide kinase/adenosylcobinamide-phosphate guanylyltransferase [Sphingomonas sp. MG17]|uniref:Bifunctional adenosylcobalamin biosynthesis protein n=1 Tax=Sphingomonas tagetis TaxID=2949092 RepID=A0A9X2KKW8_9SPHN|nr:bifunctional adenosylcobinamide kinase/adenosylcobinamide-phosphate guanylyltransferase [Sphingomonas tagetis]MCP3729821.1 bifunctional adenosylcobinamide kinase/adenosylcobinamide-phosphate guanylyltransferase [Sphingomonas tagetis]